MVIKKLILITLLFIFSTHSFAKITTTVSQSILEVNDIIQLRIKIDARVTNLNVSALERDFKIYNKYGPNISASNINGVSSISTEYIYNISPKNSGDLIIPAFNYNGESSTPIALDVRGAHQANYQDELFFLTSSISDTSAYIDQPLLLELKFYNAIDVSAANLQLPDNMPFELEQVSDTPTQTQVINGKTYQVSVLHYQITPQQSGAFEIESFEINGQYAINRRNKTFSTQSSPISIEVKPIPAQYPKNKPWLPASNIMLQDNLAESFNLTEAENLTRIIDIQMTGLNNNYLPKLEVPNIAGVKIYSEEEIRQDKVINQQNTGLIQAKWAILPAKNGKAVLPEYSITWWDVNSDQLRVSKINQRTINISGISDQAKFNNQAPLTDIQIIEKTPLWAWLTIFSILCGWVISVLILLKKIKALKKHEHTTQTQTKFESANMRNQASVIQACKHKSMTELKQALIHFKKHCQSHEMDYSIYEQQLEKYLTLLDDHLYKQAGQANTQPFDFIAFMKAFKSVKATKINNTQNEEPAFNLYPNN